MTISENIKKYRKNAGITQRELAEKCHCATGTIQQYELGKRQPRLEQLQKISDALEVSLSDLIGNNYNDISEKSFQLHAVTKEREIALKDNLQKIWKECGFSSLNPPKTEADRDKVIEMSAKFEMLEHFEKMNLIGKQKAVYQVELISKIPEYQKNPQQNRGNFSSQGE